MVIVIGLSLALTAMAAFGFSWFYYRASAQSSVSELIADLHYAQSEAITRNSAITLCGSRDGIHCDGDWSSGRLIINLASHHRYRYRHIKSRGRWFWRSSFGLNDYLKFAPTGFTLGQQGRFSYCDSPSLPMKQVVVSASGKFRVQQEERELCASYY